MELIPCRQATTIPWDDPPQTRDREDPKWAERRKREYSERLKREYGDA
jgi:hypothetical protein